MRSGEAIDDSNLLQIDLPVDTLNDEFIDKMPNQVLQANDQFFADLDDVGTVNLFISVREITWRSSLLKAGITS